MTHKKLTNDEKKNIIKGITSAVIYFSQHFRISITNKFYARSSSTVNTYLFH